MIGNSFRLVFFAALGLGISWAGYFLVPGMPCRIAAWDAGWYSEAFPRGPRSVDPGEGEPGACPESLLARVLVARRVRTSWSLAPFWAAGLAISILGGAILRVRLHEGTAYASPTVSFLSKRVGEAAGLAYFLWSVAPLPLPYWTVYPLLGLAILGTVGYVANLPLRL